MENSPANRDDDPFSEFEDWIAALAHQLFRARRMEDEKAIEVTMFYLEYYLTLVLCRHLRGITYLWDGTKRWVDGLSDKKVEYPMPGWLHIQTTVTWVVGQEHWHDDPFEFELELCPCTGAFRSYVFRFGDHLPLSEKAMRGTVTVPPGGLGI